MPWFKKSKKKKRKSKSRIVKKRRFSNPEYLIFLFKKMGLAVASIVLIIWLGAWFFMSDADTQTYAWADNKIDLVAADAGFTLQNILVRGRYNTSSSSIKQAIGLKKGDPLLSFNSKKAKETLLQEEWIESVTVKRIFPDTISIVIEERVPMALWQKDKKLFLIDNRGLAITDKNLSEFNDMIIITGENSGKNAVSLFSSFKAVPKIFYNIETAQFVSNRRWNLTMKNGTIIKLPESNIPFALSSLQKMHEQEKILDKSLEYIDLRDMKRITIKTKPGAVQEYRTYRDGITGSGDSI